MNSEMVKSEMVVLTVRENTDVTDTDVTVSWIIQSVVRAVLGERGSEKADMT
jgi:hypothetical protein